MKSLLIALALNAHAATLPTLPIEKMEAQLDKTVALVFNDESEALYGDLLQNKLQLGKVCEALKKMTVDKPRAIFLDIDITLDPAAAKCIADVARENGLRLTADFDPHTLGAQLKDDLRHISVGTALVATKVMKDFEFEVPPAQGRQWLNPKTRVSLVKPAAIPFIQPAYFINLVNGLDEKDLRKLNISWVRAVAVAEFSEAKTPKMAIQDVIAGNTRALAGKYVFLGVDQDKYDAMSNAQGEIVNGVFVHQQLAAAYLALMAGDLNPVKAPMIIFGDFAENE